MRLVALALALVSFPIAAAAPGERDEAPTLRVQVTPQFEEIGLEPGRSGSVPLTIRVDFREMTCESGTKAGVDLVISESLPDWMGASIQPMGDTYSSPSETKTASLGIQVHEDAPPGETGNIPIQPVVKAPDAGACGGVQPGVEAPPTRVIVQTPSPTTADGDGEGGASPGPGWFPGLLAGLAAVGFRRRRHG